MDHANNDTKTSIIISKVTTTCKGFVGTGREGKVQD